MVSNRCGQDERAYDSTKWKKKEIGSIGN